MRGIGKGHWLLRFLCLAISGHSQDAPAEWLIGHEATRAELRRVSRQLLGDPSGHWIRRNWRSAI